MTKEIEILRALWAHKEVDYSEKEIREALDMAIKALKKVERWEKHYCFDCKYFTENEEEYDEERCLKCTLIGTEWEQKK